MKDAIFAIRVGSPSSKTTSVKRTFESIKACFSEIDFLVLISIGDNISQDVRELVIRHAETEPFRIFSG